MGGGPWDGWRLVARIGAFVAGYVGLLVLAEHVAFAPAGVSHYWWPPLGLAVGVLARAPRRVWPALLVPVTIAGGVVWSLGGPQSRQLSLPLILLWSMSVAVPPLIGALIMGKLGGRPFLLQRSRNVAIFVVFGALLPALCDGLFVTVGWWLVRPRLAPPLEPVLWWSAAMTGAISVAPLVLTLPLPGHRHRLDTRRLPEAAALLAGLCLAAWAIFHLPSVGLQVIALAGATFPLLGWAAVRFGTQAGALAAAFLTAWSSWQTLQGAGPFGIAGVDPGWLRIAYVQGFFAFATVSTLLIASLSFERRLAMGRQKLLLETGEVLAQPLPLNARIERLAVQIVEAMADKCEIVLGGFTASALHERNPTLGVPRVYPIPDGSQEEALGELRLWPRPEHRDFSNEEGEVASILASSIGSTEETERLERGLEREVRSKSESLAQLDAVVGSSPMGIAIFDTNLRYTRINEALATLNKKPVAAHTGRTPSEMIPSLAPGIEESLRLVVSSGEAREAEISLPDPTRPDEVCTWFCLYFPVRDPVQGIIGVGAFVMDITGTKREQEALARSEERFRSLVVASAQIVWAVDAEGHGREGVEAWNRFTGQTIADFDGREWLEAIHPDDRQVAIDRTSAGYSKGETFEFEYRLRRRDGVFRQMVVRSVPVKDNRGRVREWVGMILDVTDRFEAEAERNRLLVEAQEAIRLRDDFLTIASHELKTPLTPLSARLQGMQRLAGRGMPIEPEQVAKTRASLDKLTFLINDLLDVSRIRQARLALHRAPFSLVDVLQVVARAYEDRSDLHRIELDLPHQEVKIDGDRRRIEQVFLSLVDNAIKYSPEGGVVGIHLQLEEKQAIASVSDQGIGIPKEEQPRLFDRFFRARNSLVTSYGGLGLGLYISRDIVEHHGGRIWVESAPGVGSTFFVSLPLTQQTNGGPPE